ncbi:hypothetical protein ACHAWO_008885 [Cyclotella atomus]|uniref:Uncharacterized protein n=1 Tax=Cyclotella atomus TaxID=382360 RepID=A0ABD3NW99_9STRA
MHRMQLSSLLSQLRTYSTGTKLGDGVEDPSNLLREQNKALASDTVFDREGPYWHGQSMMDRSIDVYCNPRGFSDEIIMATTRYKLLIMK